MIGRRKPVLLVGTILTLIFLGIRWFRIESRTSAVSLFGTETNIRDNIGNPRQGNADFVTVAPITCKINEEVRQNVGLSKKRVNFKCLHGNGNETFIPFSFLKKYFDVSKEDVFTFHSAQTINYAGTLFRSMGKRNWMEKRKPSFGRTAILESFQALKSTSTIQAAATCNSLVLMSKIGPG